MTSASASAEAEKLLAAGKLAEAESILKPWIEQNPQDAAAHANLGLIAYRRNELAAAREWLARAVALAPRDGAAQSNLAAVLARLSDFAAAERHARAALDIDPANDEATVTLAECLAAQGDFDAAERYYALAGRFPRWGVAAQVRFGREFFDLAQAGGVAPQLPTVRWLAAAAAEQASHILYVACSPDYLERYGGSLVESLAENGAGGGLLHLHCIGGDDGLLARLARLPQRYPRLAMTLSAEAPDLAGLDEGQRVAFYTGLRFLRVPELLRQYGKPVITLDVDAIIKGATSTLAEAARGADIALMQRAPQRIAWTNVLAGAAVFNPTPGGLGYARLVKGYIAVSMAAGRLAWHLDQIALYCSLVMLRRFGAGPAVRELNAAAEQTIHQLSPLRGDKLADPRYREYYAEI